ncbi:MAG TPA: hypothetical protein VD993_15325 [Chitinophagaceae bacterium]|nr:hypothetical protein [Chitinophagaceae bacterium]
MIIDQRQVQYFKAVAAEQYVPMILQDYGGDKGDLLAFFTDTITDIYRHLQYNTFKTVTIYTALAEESFLSRHVPSTIVINGYENLSPLRGDSIVIEVKPTGELQYLIDFELDIGLVRANAISYRFTKALEQEVIFGKASERRLRSIPDADSYFAIQTYKDLDVALEDYSTKLARHSECAHLRDVWFDESRIFFKARPEHILRDSLTQFLKGRVRNSEVRPEQIVDRTHPVDIKVTWSLAPHLALIEIKWLGKSLMQRGKSFKQIYNRQRALDGAKQLSDYLDENRRQAPVKTTKGYLVIYDGRRWGCNSTTTTVTRVNGLRYENDNIIYDPDYHSIRSDFARPIRFFLEPIMTG